MLALPTLSAPALPGLLDAPPDTLRAWLAERRQPLMRRKQALRWIMQGRATSFDQMSDLPKGLRDEMATAFTPLASTVARLLVSSDGTEKLLLRLADGALVECVLLKEEDRRTVCVSTQVGCGMGCVFCASGIERRRRATSPRPKSSNNSSTPATASPPTSASRTSSSWAWASRWPTSTRCSRRSMDLACSPEGLGISRPARPHLDGRPAREDEATRRSPGQAVPPRRQRCTRPKDELRNEHRADERQGGPRKPSSIAADYYPGRRPAGR